MSVEVEEHKLDALTIPTTPSCQMSLNDGEYQVKRYRVYVMMSTVLYRQLFGNDNNDFVINILSVISLYEDIVGVDG